MQIIIKVTCSIFMSLNNFFIKFLLLIRNCLRNHQLNIIKIIKKNFKKTREGYQSLSKEEKEKKQQYGSNNKQKSANGC